MVSNSDQQSGQQNCTEVIVIIKNTSLELCAIYASYLPTCLPPDHLTTSQIVYLYGGSISRHVYVCLYARGLNYVLGFVPYLGI